MQPSPISKHLPQKYERLARRLEEFSSAARPGQLSLAMRLDGDPLFLTYDGPGTLETVDRARCPRVPAACLAKPITATLLAGAGSALRLDWNSRIDDVLEFGGPARSHLAGVTFCQLLNHTHGLDASMIEAVPRTREGFIDAAALCAQLATKPLSAPGELYSYSSAGAWLAGAALERLTGELYSCLLSASPYVASSGGPQVGQPSSVCPATGGSLELTLAQWLSFAELHASSSPLSHDPLSQSLASLRSSQAPLPGWSPSEQAACLGWKYYGEGWFGHTANTATSTAFLRFNPADHMAIVMSATSEIALFAFSCLFRDYFPELKSLKFPRRLTAKESESLRPESYAGTYAQAKTRILIARTDAGRLSFAVAADDPGLRASEQLLQAAESDIFLPDVKRPPDFPFIQFLRSPHCDSFTHIWNGKQLWRRT